MENKTYVNWDGKTVGLTWQPYKQLRASDIVTSVHGYCFLDEKLVLVQVKGRGFNVPGGHVEKGEVPEQALRREVYEEAYIAGELTYIGAIEVDHSENEKFTENKKYPKVGYQLFYRMDITECFPFLRQYETTARIWVEPEQVPHVMNDHEVALLVLKEAMANKRKMVSNID
ncbi:NUDIX domain-containing protein [Planococcus sp. CP5-4]|uniref:NUDIX domain-containing protein n=1 Tax=unclassified Planococcus (in: firmicutes) TaxID=2662419 RepID=UPI0027E43603|nr:NUDIX domain-containing protein [Planococcus sp. CP5-4]